jgi:UV excision repair protein RAD23
VLALKEKIVASGNATDAARLKLIHTGRILANEKSLHEYNVKDGEHMVMMVTTVNSGQVKPTTISSPVNPPKTELQEKKPVVERNDDKSESETEEFKETVKNIAEMGYSDREIVSKALKLSNGDPDRAVELLESVPP